MNKVHLNNNTTLKLQNVLCQVVDMFDESLQIDCLVRQVIYVNPLDLNKYFYLNGGEKNGNVL